MYKHINKHKHEYRLRVGGIAVLKIVGSNPAAFYQLQGLIAPHVLIPAAYN